MKNKFHHKEKANPVKSVQKALSLLDAVIHADLSGSPSTLSDLASQAGMPNNSAHNLLKTLVICDYVRQGGRGVYQMGSKCLQLKRISHAGSEQVRQAILDELGGFAAEYREFCILATLINGERAILAQLESDQAVSVSQATIKSEAFFNKPTGRLLAAFADPVELQQIIDHCGMPLDDWGGIDTFEKLQQELAVLRQQEYCVIEDSKNGLAAVAVAILTPDQQSSYVLGAYSPMYRCDSARCAEFVKALNDIGIKLSKILYA